MFFRRQRVQGDHPQRFRIKSLTSGTAPAHGLTKQQAISLLLNKFSGVPYTSAAQVLVDAVGMDDVDPRGQYKSEYVRQILGEGYMDRLREAGVRAGQPNPDVVILDLNELCKIGGGKLVLVRPGEGRRSYYDLPAEAKL